MAADRPDHCSSRNSLLVYTCNRSPLKHTLIFRPDSRTVVHAMQSIWY